MSPQIVNAFIASCVLLAVAIAGYFAKKWIDSVDGLKAAVTALNSTLTGVATTQALHGERLDQHRGELDELWGLSCQNPSCPHRGDRRKPERT